MNLRRIFFIFFLLTLAVLSSCNNEDEDPAEISLDYFVEVEAKDDVQVNDKGTPANIESDMSNGAEIHQKEK